MDSSLSLIITLIALLLSLSLFTYLAWFKPDRFRTFGLPPKRIRKLLDPICEPLWQLQGSDLALWLARLLGPINIVILLAVLIWVLLYESGFCP